MGAEPTQRTILQGSGGKDDGDGILKRLHLCCLGCEDQPNYGTYAHTAQLFFDLIWRCMEERTMEDAQDPTVKYDRWELRIDVYHVKEGDFPDDWNAFDGFILPGSFASAYEDEEWIHRLSEVIQTELMTQQRKTLGVCFGHQVIAQSFATGKVTKCPVGSQAGRKALELTDAGKRVFSRHGDPEATTIDLFYTHGDMVEQLPADIAVSLGGNDIVPIQSAAYFASHEDAAGWVSSSDDDADGNNPIAITFQAHPEYTSPKLGFEKTMLPIIEYMATSKHITESKGQEEMEDSKQHYGHVEKQSLQTMMSVGEIFGWY